MDQPMTCIPVVVMAGIAVGAHGRMRVGYGGVGTARETQRRKEESKDEQSGQKHTADRNPTRLTSYDTGQLTTPSARDAIDR